VHPCEVHQEVVASAEAGVALREGSRVGELPVGDLLVAALLAVVAEGIKSALQHHVSKVFLPLLPVLIHSRYAYVYQCVIGPCAPRFPFKCPVPTFI
jgi:hypothetical protein